LLKHVPALKLNLLTTVPWSELELRDAARIVRDYVNLNDSTIENDSLKEWLEEYQFAIADRKQ
jgi:hypothetical protein